MIIHFYFLVYVYFYTDNDIYDQTHSKKDQVYIH